jgi:hypothetical protein
VHDKLIQYDICDDDGDLIPIWLIEHGLRPGTVVMISAELHVYHIKNENGAGFRQVRGLDLFTISCFHVKQRWWFFQVSAEKIRVLAKALQYLDPVTTTGNDAQSTSNAVGLALINDFTSYRSRKRKAVKTEEEPKSKKGKHAESSDTQEDSDQMNVEEVLSMT